jgi:hypothetical protein
MFLKAGCSRHNPQSPPPDSYRDRDRDQGRGRSFIIFFSNHDMVKLTTVPNPADTAIRMISPVVILQRITVIVPQIVPSRIENV